MSAAHGSSPYAGMVGGGSGMGSGVSGPIGFGMGGGPGAIGGWSKDPERKGDNKPWSPDDERALPMGAARKKR